VDSLSSDPRSVRDWGPIINAGVKSGLRNLWFGPFTYAFTTQILAGYLSGGPTGGVRFSGASSMWGDSGSAAQGERTRLVWNGKGSGAAISLAKKSVGWGGGDVLEHLELLYSSSSFTGPLVDFADGFGLRVRHCYFGTTSGYTGSATATCAIQLLNANDVVIDSCAFEDPADPAAFTNAAITGATSRDTFSNVVRIRDCVFYHAAALDPGANWTFEHCVFECNALQARHQAAYITATQRATYGMGVTLRECEYWDAAGGTGAIVSIPSGLACDLTAVNCMDYSAGYGALAHLYIHQGTGNILLVGGQISNVIDVGDAASPNSAKSSVTLLGCHPVPGAAKTIFANVNTGHYNVNVQGTAFGGNIPTIVDEGTITVGHERVSHNGATPTIAMHPGATNISSVNSSDATDLAGIISITTSSKGRSSTGSIVDVTFAQAIKGSDFQAGLTRNPIVTICPYFQAGGLGGSTGDAYYAAQPYVYATSDDNAKFSIGVVRAIPANTTIVLAYRVIQA
jgi:hypothetical protein